MGHFRIKKLMILVAITLLYLNRIQGMENNQDQDVKTKELLEMWEDWINYKKLNATKDKINATKDKFNAITGPDVEDDKYWCFVEYEHLFASMEVKIHEWKIKEKFNELKEFNSTFANALLEKYPELMEFLTPPKLATRRPLEEIKDIQMMENESEKIKQRFYRTPFPMILSKKENIQDVERIEDEQEIKDVRMMENESKMIKQSMTLFKRSYRTQRIEDEDDVKIKESFKILEEWIKLLNATKKLINKTKIAMTSQNCDDDKYDDYYFSEAKRKLENLLEAKMQHEFNIKEKFDELKEFDPDSANALLDKYPELAEFLTPPKVVKPRLY